MADDFQGAQGPGGGGEASGDTAPRFAKPGVGAGYGRDFGAAGRNQGFDGSHGQGYGGSTGPSDYRDASGGDAYGGGVTGADYALSFGGRGEDISGDRRWLRGAPRDAREPAGGPFGGVGPQGWTRSDSRLHELVCERLSDDPNLDASDIEVTAEDGVVTLRGQVANGVDAELAQQIVRQAPGVRDVRSELAIGGG